MRGLFWANPPVLYPIEVIFLVFFVSALLDLRFVGVAGLVRIEPFYACFRLKFSVLFLNISLSYLRFSYFLTLSLLTNSFAFFIFAIFYCLSRSFLHYIYISCSFCILCSPNDGNECFLYFGRRELGFTPSSKSSSPDEWPSDYKATFGWDGTFRTCFPGEVFFGSVGLGGSPAGRLCCLPMKKDLFWSLCCFGLPYTDDVIDFYLLILFTDCSIWWSERQPRPILSLCLLRFSSFDGGLSGDLTMPLNSLCAFYFVISSYRAAFLALRAA